MLAVLLVLGSVALSLWILWAVSWLVYEAWGLWAVLAYHAGVLALLWGSRRLARPVPSTTREED